MKHLIVTISVAVALCGCRPVPRSSNSASYVRDSLLVDYMTYVSQYSDCSSADWNAFYAMPIRQSTSDRNETFEEKIHSSWKRESLHSGCWLVLQNAKAELHRKSIPLRAV